MTTVRAAVARTAAATADLRAHGADISFRGSIVIPADETLFFLFDGQGSEVRTAGLTAGITFERVLESLRIDAVNDSSDPLWPDSGSFRPEETP